MTDTDPKRPAPSNQAGRDNPTYQAPSAATGGLLYGGPSAPSVWHDSTRLPSTIDGARRLYGDDLFDGPHD